MPIVPTDFQALIPDPASSMCATFKKWLKLPIILFQFAQQILDANGNILGAANVGDYILSGAPLAETDYRKQANGQEVSQADFPLLWTAFGQTHLYGTPTNPSNFKLPDFMGRFPAGVGTFTNPVTTATKTIQLAEAGGEELHILVNNELSSHQHPMVADKDTTGSSPITADTSIPRSNSFGGDDSSYDLTGVDPTTFPATLGKTGAAGGGATIVDTVPQADGHNNMPPYLGTFIYIRVA